MDAATSVGTQAADVLGPEASGLVDLDPALLGDALAQTARGVLTHPLPALRAMSRCAFGLRRAAVASGLQLFGLRDDPPPVTDRRFADPAWEGNAAFLAMREAYFALVRLVDDLVEAADLDPVTRQKAAFMGRFLTDAVAPTNFLPTNPTALKLAFDTGGLSVLRGMRNLADDLVHNKGRPRQVDTTPFTLGQNLAATPGQVVFRNDLMELIQYSAQTEQVHAIPLLCSPPWINKFYVMDLAPGRSFIEWAVQHGHTVFAISYRDPDDTMRDVTLDDYLVNGPVAALDVVSDITGSPQVNIVGLCLGGALTAILVAYLKARDEDRIHSVTLLNTLLDYGEPGPLGVFVDLPSIERLERRMSREGYMEGRDMAGTFDVLRANDLIFNYVAANWLMGQQPPAFDILAWNADHTRLPAAMHSFYLRSLYVENQLAGGEMVLAGQQLNLKDIDSDVFLVGAENDHIVPWRSSYRSTQLLGGQVTFVLTSAGHIAGIVNPPSPKARYWIAEDNPDDADLWRADATEHDGSWWHAWVEWMAERAGDLVPAPPTGSEAHPPLEPAPGFYIGTGPAA